MLHPIDPASCSCTSLRTAPVFQDLLCAYPAPIPGISEPQKIDSGMAFSVSPDTCALILRRGNPEALCALPGTYVLDTSEPGECILGPLPDAVRDSFVKNASAFRAETAADPRDLVYLNLKPFSFRWSNSGPCYFRVREPAICLDADIRADIRLDCLLRISDPIVFQLMLCLHENTVSKDAAADAVSQSIRMTAEKVMMEHPANSSVIDDASVVITVFNAVLRKENTQHLSPFGLSADLLRFSSLQFDASDSARIRGLRNAAIARGLLHANAHPQEFGNAQSSVPVQERPAREVPQHPVKRWLCTCGTKNCGKFCTECGSRKPEQPAGPWTCTCGNVNEGRFCTECGTPYL